MTSIPAANPVRPGGRRARRIAVLCAILGSVIAPAFGLDAARAPDEYALARWTTREGLPSDCVNVLVQSGEGYLWAGTAEGLVRFNGWSFTLFDRDNLSALRAETITALAADRSGAVWIGTPAGLVVLRPDGTSTRYDTETGLSENHVTSIVEGIDGDLWVGTYHGLNRFRAGQVTRYGRADGLPHDYVQSLLASPDGAIWIGTWNGGLARWRNGQFVAEASLGALGVNALRQDARGALWIGTTDTGLWRRAPDGGLRNWRVADGLLDDKVQSLVEDRDGNLWIATVGGLQRLRGDRIDPRPVASDRRVRSILEDREGNLWFGSRTDGLARLTDVTFLTRTTRDGLPDNEISGVLEDSHGGLWIATSGGLGHIDGGRKRTFTEADGLASDVVISLWEREPGEIWVGTRRGVNVVRRGSVSVPVGLGGVDGPVWAMTRGPDGVPWIALLNGIFRLRDDRLELVEGARPGGHAVATVMHEDPQGKFWVGTIGGGLFGYDGALKPVVTQGDPLSNDIYDVVGEGNGVLWLGTGAGLARLDRGVVTSFAGSLYGGPIFRILQDDASRLWCSSPQGVFLLDRASLETRTRQADEPLPFVRFGTGSGMASSECVGGFQPAGWRGADGRMWFPTLQGLAEVDPSRLVSNETPPPVRIESVVVDGQSFDPRGGIEVPAGRTRFEFHYAALTYRAPEAVRFRYRLEGFDQDWMSVGGTRVAHYMNLRPGRYRFVVQAVNESGVWSENEGGVILRLQPHFYMTTWFLLGAAGVVGAAGYGLYRQRRRNIEREFSAVLAERGRMARDLHDTLAQGLAGISIQLEAVEETLGSDAEATRRHLDRARGLVRSSLTEARRSVLNLRPSALTNATLPAALERVVRDLTWDRPVQVGVRVTGTPRPLPPAVENNLLRIAQEAVTNALRHGDPSRVQVEIRYDPYEVSLRLIDDGRGFDSESALRTEGERVGLLGMRERADEIEGNLAIRSQPGAGTEITVVVPIR